MKKVVPIVKSTQTIIITLLVLVLSFFVLKTNFFNSATGQPDYSSVSAIILPHHDLASAERESTLRQLVGQVSPKTIILISPNHFDTGGYNLETTDRVWRLTNSYFEPDKTKINQLNLPLVDTAFNREHGITNLLEPVKAVFGDAKIIPIIIKPGTTAGQIDELVDQLNNICQKNCLLVSSVDFSHYQPASVASIHDLLSVKALSNLDIHLIWQTEVDSNPALYMTLKWANLYGTTNFHLAANTNSGLLTHSPDAESTSYVLGWFEQGQTQTVQTQTFAAGFNLTQLADPRLAAGVDQKIDLASNHDMATLCLKDSQYCALNRLFWGPNFYRDILNGLVIEGQILPNQYKLVLVPTDPSTHLALTGEAKLQGINKIRERLGLNSIIIGDEYDTIYLNK